MTTIVCDGDRGICASDTRLSNGMGFIYPTDVEKIHLIEDDEGNRYICGGAGSYDEVQLFCAWIVNGMNQEDYPLADFSGYSDLFLMDSKGDIYSFEKSGIPIPVGRVGCFGSGGPIALGAMEAGASVEQALEIAIKYDSASGGSIYIADINDEEVGEGC